MEKSLDQDGEGAVDAPGRLRNGPGRRFQQGRGGKKGAHRKTADSASMAALTMGQLFLASLSPIRFQKMIKV
jgi:hypothetical protein